MNTSFALTRIASEYLDKRGLDPSTCEQLNIHWVDRETAITDRYGFGKLSTSPDGLIVFPLQAVGDRVVSIARNFYESAESEVKHLEAINKYRLAQGQAAVKKVPKYLLPRGDRASGKLYDPYSLLHPDSDRPVLFATEDVIGVAKAASRGLRIVSTFGVWLTTNADMVESQQEGWTHDLCGEFPSFLADSDAIEKPGVVQALIRTGFTVGCDIGYFPSTDKERKVGLDEWLEDNPNCTESDLEALVQNHASDALGWLENLLPKHLDLLGERGYNPTKQTQIASPVRKAILDELLKHTSTNDLRANGFYQRVLKPLGINLETLQGIERKSRPQDYPSESRAFDLLIEIASELVLFRQDTELGETYADVVTEGIRRTYRLRSKEFKAWLTSEMYLRHRKPSNSEALETCLKVCEGQARSRIEPVWMRVAEYGGKIYVDLCNEKWQAIEIGEQGWRVVESVELPVRFTRSPVQQPLPLPASKPKGQGLESLWNLLSVAEESKPLVTAWLLSCLVPTGDKPILVLSAPKGSGKSTIARFLVDLIDPTKAALLPAVGDRRALAVTANHRWIFAFDNLTKLSVEQQDAMCCASTGAGYMERQLFTDNDVTFVEYRRPQILTSVDLVPTRSDLLDRCLLVKIKPMPKIDRKTNEAIAQDFQACHAEIFGALLSLLTVALKNLDSVRQPLERMSSFHKLALAANIPGFNETYSASVKSAQSEAIKADPIAEAISELGSFEGTARELVVELKKLSDDPKVQRLTSRAIGRLLNGTLKSDLEAVGISTDDYRQKDRNRTRMLRISQPDRQPDLMSETSETSENPQNPSKTNGSVSDVPADIDPKSADITPKSADMKNLMSANRTLISDKRPKPEPLHDKDLSHLADVSDVADIKNDHLSVSADPEVIDYDDDY
jgi:hypothetical protein